MCLFTCDTKTKQQVKMLMHTAINRSVIWSLCKRLRNVHYSMLDASFNLPQKLNLIWNGIFFPMNLIDLTAYSFDCVSGNKRRSLKHPHCCSSVSFVTLKSKWRNDQKAYSVKTVITANVKRIGSKLALKLFSEI